MYGKYLILCSLIAAPLAAASAQAGPIATKSAEQITCELTGQCGDAAVEGELRDAPETRGMSVRRQGAASATTPARATPTTTQARNLTTPATTRTAPAARPAQRSTGLAAARPASAGSSNLSIGFVSGSSTLTSSGLAQAARLLQALKMPELASSRFIVGGHTDSVGSRELNLELSRKRAQALVDYLVANGVDRSRLDPQGYGFDRPLPGRSARDGANRRVEIVKVD